MEKDEEIFEILFGMDLKLESGQAENIAMGINKTYAEHHQTYVLGCPEKLRAPAEKVNKKVNLGGAVMNKFDHAIVNQLSKELHPDLKEIISTFFLPAGSADLDDSSQPENLLRNSIVNFQESVPRYVRPDKDLSYAGGVLYIGDEVVCKAGPYTAMEYIFECYPRQAWKVYKMIMEDFKSAQGWHEQGFRNLLDYYRSFRKLSRSMNKITKIGQLDKLDQDSAYNWFPDPFDLDYEPLFVGKAPLAWRYKYPTSGVVSRGFFIENWKRYIGQVIHSNVVIGNQEGGHCNDYDLLEKLMDCERAGAVVRVQLYLEFDENIRCYLIKKPRPHNYVAIVELGDLGDTLTQHCVNLMDGIHDSNRIRNGMYFTGCSRVIKPSEITWDAMFKEVHERMEYLSYFEDKAPGAPGNRKPLAPTRLLQREKAIYDYLRNKDLKFDGGYYVADILIKTGPLFSQVPFIGPVPIAVNSLVHAARKSGKLIIYAGDTWLIV